MVTKNQIKLIQSLRQKKQRIKHQLFVAEGFKVISEFLKNDFELNNLWSTQPDLFHDYHIDITSISEKELSKISFLTSPNTSLALFKIPNQKDIITDSTILALDTINDPGNLGTIIRLSDWFDIPQIVCSKETTDIYSPKVIQSTMGSLARVNINYINLHEFLSKNNHSIYGTFMDGDSIYTKTIPTKSIIVMGNEANGISSEIEKLITQKITIPQFGKSETESLNVATATAIILSELKRNN